MDEWVQDTLQVNRVCGISTRMAFLDNLDTHLRLTLGHGLGPCDMLWNLCVVLCGPSGTKNMVLD